MIGPISAYGYNNSAVSYQPTVATAKPSEATASATTPLENSAPGVTGSGECQTCENRKYVDGSDEMVSFKAPTKINPRQAASSVRAHEQEHVTNAYSQAAKMEGGRVMQASVTMKMALCPECGRSYVAGGLTTTKIAYEKDNPYADNLKSAQRDALVGANVDAAV